jgi:hypothetical protein
VQRAGGELKIVDDKQAYFRLAPTRLDAGPVYEDLRKLMGAAPREESDERDPEAEGD